MAKQMHLREKSPHRSRVFVQCWILYADKSFDYNKESLDIIKKKKIHCAVIFIDNRALWDRVELRW